jgi:hypothetical protein
MRDYGQWSRKTAALITDRDANSHISVVYSEDFQISVQFLPGDDKNYTLIHPFIVPQ